MAISILATPAVVQPGTTVVLDIAGGTPGQVAEFTMLSVPRGSSVPLGLLRDADGNLFVPEPAFQEADKRTSSFIPDVAGVYELRATVFQVFAGVKQSPGGQGNVDALNTYRRVLKSTVDGTVYAGVTKSLRIAGAGHEVTLEIVLNNDTVVAAALTNQSPGSVALAVTLDATVNTKLDALVGLATAALGEDMITGIADYKDTFNDHLAFAGMGNPHTVADTTNTIARGAAGSMAAAIGAINDALDHTLRHLQDNPVDEAWHAGKDFVHMPINGKANDEASAYVLYVDLTRRVYERHRVTVASTPNAVHTAADNTNSLTAISALSDLIVSVLDYFADLSPTTPTGQNQGDIGAEARYGFFS